MVTIKKTWETVFFTAKNKMADDEVTVELNYNHETGSYTIGTANQEDVSFDDKNIDITILKLEAVKAAVSYLKQFLKPVL